MYSQQQVGIAVLHIGPNQGTRACLTCCYMPHMHRLFIVLHIFHDPIWGQIEDEIFCSDLTLHRVLCVAHKKAMQETGLYHMICLQLCVKHLFCLGHENHTHSTFFGWKFFCTCPDPLHWWVQTIFLKFPCKTDVSFHSWVIHCHMCVIHFYTSQ